MDVDLRCNRLTCRRALSDKAVVTTCSHIFCVDCANELFNSARLCPACETTLSEPDDVVVCSLHPTNDYKTSVLSGLSPTIILEICGRAISFWQYQIHQESSFQQAVVRNLNDKNAQLQKQLENVIREANGEINLLGGKVSELERDLELERRKIRDLQDSTRERDKEYAKLKAQYDRIKRKALLAPNSGQHDPAPGFGPVNTSAHMQDDHKLRSGLGFGVNLGNTVDFGAVVGGMEANGIQRTPVINRTVGGPPRTGISWPQNTINQQRAKGQRQPFGRPVDRSFHGGSVSDRSADSANEVENLLHPSHAASRTSTRGGLSTATRNHAFTTSKRMANGFRPAVPVPR